MASSNLSKNQDTIFLKDLIVYFANTVAYLPIVKLNKLLYIANLYHYASHEDLLIKSRFFSRTYGPYSPTIPGLVNEDVKNNKLFMKKARTSDDPVYSNPTLVLKSNVPLSEKFSRICLNTLEEVHNDWGDEDYQSIIEYTNRTIPYLATTYMEKIDFTVLPPSADMKQVLDLSQRTQIHNFLESIENINSPRVIYDTSSKFTVHEIAEIYFALVGSDPEKLPSREYLGFEAQAIFEACNILNENKLKNKETHFVVSFVCSLLNSMSFKQYNTQIALTAGMLFLSKKGYQIKRAAIEDNWPLDISYDTIKDWLNKVIIN